VAIATAVLLAIPTSAATASGGGPFDRLAGLSLLLRSALTLQKEGITELIVIARIADVARVQAELRDARFRLRATVVGAPSRIEGVASLASTKSPAVLICAVEHACDPSILRELISAPLSAHVAVAAMSSNRRIGPVAAAPELLTRIAAAAKDPQDVGALGDVALRATGALDAVIDRLYQTNRVLALDVGTRWHARLDNVRGRDDAFHQLFEACRKPVDGIVSTNLNRHVSIFISKRLVNTSITPNQISIFTFTLAIAGAALATRGTYVTLLAAAFLMQWNSILDGCDGELARVRFQHSKLGQWIDTVCDDASNLLFYGGITLGSQALPLHDVLTILGLVAMGSLVVSVAITYTLLIRMGSGDFYALGWSSDAKKNVLVLFFERLLKKDFFIFLYLVMAAFDALPYALAVAAFGHVIAMGASVASAFKASSRAK
jgi:phosphatidylglycerophosphate synthase